ncbi:MAG: hypothetical protein N2Z62_15315 [Rhodobacteraceae bacterium]|nr:hypothetical protein [Paracoccaceae bacterium]
MSERLTTWAVDLADVGPVYPFQGMEWLFLVICVAGWIGWHVWCFRWERAYQRDRIARYGRDTAAMHRAIDSD